jgi:hypothetical protein
LNSVQKTALKAKNSSKAITENRCKTRKSESKEEKPYRE